MDSKTNARNKGWQRPEPMSLGLRCPIDDEWRLLANDPVWNPLERT